MDRFENLVPQPKSRFLRVKCLDCGSEQIIFGCASTQVRCLVCDKVLTIPRGSKAKIKTQIISVLT
ncbi:MAG: 30S ribosomal protein S27e [Candidatus Helarchaeota archaeon]